MKKIYFILIICAWSIGVYAQTITTPSGYDIRTVSVKNACEEDLYAALASKAAASINDDNSLRYQLSVCASNRGGTLVYRGTTYSNPLPQPYANTYWRRKAECDKSKQSGTDSVNSSASGTNSGNNDYGSSDNNKSQDGFAELQRKNVEGNDVTIQLTEIAINNLNVSRDEIQDDFDSFRENKIDLADKYRKKGGANNSRHPLAVNLTGNRGQNRRNQNFETFMNNFLPDSSFTDAERVEIEKTANSVQISNLRSLVEWTDFANWENTNLTNRQIMLENLVKKYLSQMGINNFVEFDASEFGEKSRSLSHIPPIISNRRTEGIIAQCWPPAFIKSTNILKVQIDIQLDALQTCTAYEAIAYTLHEARHAYQYYQIEEEYKKSKQSTYDKIRSVQSNEGNGQTRSSKTETNQKVSANVNTETIEKWHDEITKFNEINDNIKYLEDLLTRPEVRLLEEAKIDTELAIEEKKRIYGEVYQKADVEKDANRTAAIYTLALRRIYNWE